MLTIKAHDEDAHADSEAESSSDDCCDDSDDDCSRDSDDAHDENIDPTQQTVSRHSGPRRRRPSPLTAVGSSIGRTPKWLRWQPDPVRARTPLIPMRKRYTMRMADGCALSGRVLSVAALGRRRHHVSGNLWLKGALHQ